MITWAPCSGGRADGEIADALFISKSTGVGACGADQGQLGATSLGRFTVPAATNGLSFLGVVFDRAVVARVRIEYGTVALGPDDGPQNDVAVMDDFIYGEPQPMS